MKESMGKPMDAIDACAAIRRTATSYCFGGGRQTGFCAETDRAIITGRRKNDSGHG